MKSISSLLAGLLLLSCQNKTKAPEKSPQALAPVSAPSTKKTTDSAPAAALVVASAPASEPTSIKLPTIVPSDAQFFPLEVDEDLNGKTVISHPDPAMQKKLTELFQSTQKEYTEDCEITAATTALFSFVCADVEEPPPGDRSPLSEVMASAYNFALVDGELVPLFWKDIFVESPALTAWLKKNDLPPPADVNTNTSFVIDEDGESVVLLSYLSGFLSGFELDAYKRIDMEKEAALLQMQQFPLATLAKTGELVSVNVDPESLRHELKPIALSADTLPAGLVVEGDFIDGLQWKDKNGEYYLILSSLEKTSKDGLKRTRYLYASRYTKTDAELVKTRLIIEKEESCTTNNMADFIEDSLALTDLDRDQIAEVSMAYWLGCISEEASIPLKLLLAEGDDKYNLKGTTKTVVAGGDYKPSYTFPAAPNVFLRFAEHRWELFKIHPETPSSLPTAP